MVDKTRSFLKWAGGKYACLDLLRKVLPAGKRLIEPFTGSGVVFLNTDYSAYLLGEANNDLVNLFLILQSQGEEFIHYCQQYFCAQTNSKQKYYEIRDQFNTSTDIVQRAALFLYLNRHGYNGLCRYNATGKFNVPFGLYTKPFFPQQAMRVFHQKSQNAHIKQNDFRQTFALAERGDVIYCDPPYVPAMESSKNFAYHQIPFGEQDHIELAELAVQAAGKGIPVIISNHDTAFTRLHYRRAKIKSFCVQRFISCQGAKRMPVKELLALFV